MEPEYLAWRVEFIEFSAIERALKRLRPNQLRVAVGALVRDFETHGLDLFAVGSAKHLGRGLAEYRYRDDPEVLVRFFFYLEVNRCVVVLSAYDKKRAPSASRQQKEIAKARKIMQQLNRK
jgi:phage-related protein